MTFDLTASGFLINSALFLYPDSEFHHAGEQGVDFKIKDALSEYNV